MVDRSLFFLKTIFEFPCLNHKSNMRPELMTGDAVEQLRHMELSESDLAQLDLPDWWKWWNCATGWRVGG